MYGGGNRTDNPQNASVSDENDGPGVHWNWKVGDQCVARYWEDERVCVNICFNLEMFFKNKIFFFWGEVGCTMYV